MTRIAKDPATRRALPARFRRPRLLVLGCGDVGLRLARLVAGRARVFGTVRRDEAAGAVRAAGAVPVRADLDERASLARLQGLARWVVHLAPPPSAGPSDPRTRRAIASLARAPARGAPMVARAPRAAGPGPTVRGPAARRVAPATAGLQPARRWSYVSTTGVYGNRAGATIDERAPAAPTSDRARRRVDAERRVREAVRRGAIAAAVLRAPGIYAIDRLPIARLRAGTPAIVDAEDSFSNHVHADDLARGAWLALLRARNGRTFNAVDASGLKMGQWFDLVADAAGLARPPRVPRAEVARHVSPQMLSFMAESRRIRGDRWQRELRLRLAYPTVQRVLQELARLTELARRPA